MSPRSTPRERARIPSRLDATGAPPPILLGLLLLGTLVLGAPPAGAQFAIEAADGSANDVGRYAALALDADGDPHLTYRDATTGDLMYARKEGGVWTIERADTTGDAGWHTAIALDGGGNPHIHFLDVSCDGFECNYYPTYASKTGGSWTYEGLEFNSYTDGGSVSLGIDSQDVPRFLYVTNGLGYKKGVDLWASPEEFPGIVTIGSLVVDAQDDPHVAYKAGLGAGSTATYGRRANGSWTIETIETGNLGYWPSIALDSLGNPHVSYEDAANHDLRYARRIAGAWVVTAADGSPNSTGQFTSIAIDAQNRPHIAYYDDTTHDLLYAVGPAAPSSVPLPEGVAIALRVAPNPVRVGDVRFLFRAPPRAAASLSVFEASGRLVAAIPVVRAASDEGFIPWDGRDARGLRVAPGTYLVRLEAGGAAQTARFTVIR